MKPRVLYSKEESNFLSEREEEWKLHDQQKIEVILSQTGDDHSLIEVGCGSGQILKEIVKRVLRAMGVDESADML